MKARHILVLLVAVGLLFSARADIPLMINHQGLVKVNGVPFTGNGLFKFGLISAGGNWLWTNDGSHVGAGAGSVNPDNAVIIPVNNGIYNVRLGEPMTSMVAIPSSVFADDVVTLRVIFDDGTIGSQVLAPDQPMGSVAYAYRAGDADTVNGKTADDLSIAGEVKMWAGTIAAVPTGWFPCDGRAVSRTTYSELFAAIGTIYGTGDGSTTFNIPDFRNRGPIGAQQDDTGVPKTNVTGALTQTGGEATHTLTTNEMPAHTHQQMTTNSGAAVPTPATYKTGGSTGVEANSYDHGGFYVAGTIGPLNTLSRGGDQPHNVLDPYLAITFIINY